MVQCMDGTNANVVCIMNSLAHDVLVYAWSWRSTEFISDSDNLLPWNIIRLMNSKSCRLFDQQIPNSIQLGLEVLKQLN